MTIKYYMDVHVKRAVTEGLRRRGVEVLTAQEADMQLAEDIEHIEYARRGGWIIFTNDVDFLRLHASGVEHGGVAYCHQQTSIGQMIQGLMLIFQVLETEKMKNRVEYI